MLAKLISSACLFFVLAQGITLPTLSSGCECAAYMRCIPRLLTQHAKAHLALYVLFHADMCSLIILSSQSSVKWEAGSIFPALAAPFQPTQLLHKMYIHRFSPGNNAF